MNPGEVVALLQQGQRDDALAAAAQAVNDNPQDAGWRVVLGAVLVEMDQLTHGERVLRDALGMAPELPDALFNLSVALRRQGRIEEQADCLARIAPTWSGNARVAQDLGQAGLWLLMAGRHEAAVRAYRALLALQPGARPASYNLALALMGLSRYDEAIVAIAGALGAGHVDAELLGMLVHAKGQACEWRAMDESIEELRRAAREPGKRPAHPQDAQYLAQVTAAEQKQWAESYCRAIYAGLEPIERRSSAPRTQKLRVGFLSSDFRDHAVSWLVVGLIENLDRDRFEIRTYSTGPRVVTPVRERIARAVDQFVDCSTVTGRVVAERIAADGTDVLVDLGGLTGRARLDILAYRGAPVQGHYLGYPGTTGAAFVDFFVADEVTVPPGAEGDFTERVLRMPRCFMPNDPKRPIPEPMARAGLGLREDAVVLCSFNQPIKIRPAIFEAWCALLQSVPNTMLMLRDPGEAARRRLQAHAARWQVDGRLVFTAHLPSREDHMARLASADIALDTFPYGSHTNAADALWAGVPLVTAYGGTFASRVGTSMLTTAGLPEWAFDDPRKALDFVASLARDPAKLAAAKQKARAARSSALFDAAAHARDFERLLLVAAGRLQG